MRWSSRSVAESIGCGGRSTTKARCSTSWSSLDAALDRRGDCCESCLRSRVSRQSASPRTSSNPIPSPSGSSGFPRSMIKACGRTIGRKTHTSRFGGENENSSGSNRLDQPNVSCRSTLPSKTPSTSNAIFCHAASSRIFVPRRLLSGSRVASQPDRCHGALWPTAPVNVSVPGRALSD